MKGAQQLLKKTAKTLADHGETTGKAAEELSPITCRKKTSDSDSESVSDSDIDSDSDDSTRINAAGVGSISDSASSVPGGVEYATMDLLCINVNAFDRDNK